MKTLFEQLTTESELGAVAGLCYNTNCPAFRNALRETPAINRPFTMGDAALAVLNTITAKLRK